jgi:hypothetical protein
MFGSGDYVFYQITNKTVLQHRNMHLLILSLFLLTASRCSRRNFPTRWSHLPTSWFNQPVTRLALTTASLCHLYKGGHTINTDSNSWPRIRLTSQMSIEVIIAIASFSFISTLFCTSPWYSHLYHRQTATLVQTYRHRHWSHLRWH